MGSNRLLFLCRSVSACIFGWSDLCSRNALFRWWSHFSSNKAGSVSRLWLTRPYASFVVDKSQKKTCHVFVSPPCYIAVSALLDGEYSGVLRWAHDKGFSRCAKYRMSFRLKRPSCVYWHSLRKKAPASGFFPLPMSFPSSRKMSLVSAADRWLESVHQNNIIWGSLAFFFYHVLISSLPLWMPDSHRGLLWSHVCCFSKS